LAGSTLGLSLADVVVFVVLTSVSVTGFLDAAWDAEGAAMSCVVLVAVPFSCELLVMSFFGAEAVEAVVDADVADAGLDACFGLGAAAASVTLFLVTSAW